MTINNNLEEATNKQNEEMSIKELITGALGLGSLLAVFFHVGCNNLVIEPLIKKKQF